MKTLSITIDEHLVKALDRNIKKFQLSGRSEAIREALQYWLKKGELKNKIEQEIEAYKKKPVQDKELESFWREQEWPE